jgi:hypothetical protein
MINLMRWLILLKYFKSRLNNLMDLQLSMDCYSQKKQILHDIMGTALQFCCYPRNNHRSVIGHAAAPHNIIFLGQYSEWRVSILV